MGFLDYELAAEHPAWRPEHDLAAEIRRDADAVQAHWERADTSVLVVGQGTVQASADVLRPHVVRPDAAPDGERIFLGLRTGTPWFAVRVADPRPSVGGDPVPLRELVPRMPAADAALVLQAIALANWHDTHPRCPRCGEPTDVVHGGYARRCGNDGSLHFPRTDPAVIVLVLDEQGDDDPAGRCLLGRSGAWPEGRMSTLAGFVEPAETVEDAVRREVAEEVGVRVGEVRYVGSQPWPFPSSLMLACYARASTTDINPDGEEIVEARWLTRDQLTEQVVSGALVLPPDISVARRLIEGWVGQALPSRGAFRPA